MRIASFLAAAFMVVAAHPSFAQALPVANGAIEGLAPGQYLWAPAIAPEGPVTVIVSLATQRAYAYRNGVPIGVSTVSTGKEGHRTPTGIFTILQKAVDHKSNLYSDAPMPFMQRLTWDGVAMHAGQLPGYPASHGCIRLPLAFAKLLYGATRMGVTVIITASAVVPEVASEPEVLAAAPSPGRKNKQDFWWRPERSLRGPVSVVVSGRDRRIVVLRNGVRIGSSALEIDGPVTETTAFTLAANSPAGLRWLRLVLPGPKTPAPAEMTAAERARGHMPEEFRASLAAILQPGATLLVTRDTLKSSDTGKRLTVVSVEGS